VREMTRAGQRYVTCVPTPSDTVIAPYWKKG
jgi:hypothetical protein